MNKKTYLWLIPPVIWMAVIFMFSGQTGIESADQSEYVTGGIMAAINRLFSLNLSSDSIELVDIIIDTIVRKLAHFLEYLILAVLVYIAVSKVWSIVKNRGYILSTLVVFLYASSDEIHQLFVPGRFGCFADVLLDTAGGAMGCLFIHWIVKARKNKVII